MTLNSPWKLKVNVPPAHGELGLSISIVNPVLPALRVGPAARVSPSGLLKLPATTVEGTNVPQVISSVSVIPVVSAATYPLIS